MANVLDAGPTLYKCYTDVLRLLSWPTLAPVSSSLCSFSAALTLITLVPASAGDNSKYWDFRLTFILQTSCEIRENIDLANYFYLG